MLKDSEKKMFIDNLHSCYVKPMIINYVNNEQDMVNLFFNTLKYSWSLTLNPNIKIL